jgi:diacylglycerol kinase
MNNKNFFHALYNAYKGMEYVLLHQRNAIIQICCAAIVVFAGICLQISMVQWLCVLLCIGMVLCLEIMNTAIEKLCNLVNPNYHPTIKIIKDVAAAAVLFAAIISLAVATLIFLPLLF